MSPRTNESAPQNGRPRPDEGTPEPDERAEPTDSDRSTGTGSATASIQTADDGFAAAIGPGADARSDVAIEPGADTKSDATNEPGADTKSDATNEPGADTKSDAGPESVSEAEGSPVAGAEADSASGGESGSGSKSEGLPEARLLPGRGAASRRGRESAPESGRRRLARVTACAAALAVAFTGFAVALGARDDDRTVAMSSSPGVSAAQLAGGDLDTAVERLQAHLKAQPKDFGSWSTLGLAYVEQARVKGDPSRYPQAEKALQRSLELRPDNDPALAGLAALAAARHEFEDALRYADKALQENPYSERALCSRVDALVELGRYDDALKAVRLADTRRPGIPVFTRYAYVYELRGDVKTARRVLEQALDSAATRGDIAYVASQLGQLAWKQGDYKTSLDHYARALGADDTYLPALEGRARAQAASGDDAEAIRGLEQVVSSYPLPGPLVVLGELYEAKGDKTKAGDQYALVDAYTAIARSNGVNADLDTALAAADHGDTKSALRAAEAEWKRRETVHTADALAWALHVNGRDEEALPYARRATATGYKDATFLYHRGMVEYAAGDKKDARTSLKAALDLNAGFSPLGAAEARKTLKALQALETAK
ncbi:tetratricopeptide repeat protein [Streptomyces sp. MB09-02B]|uniref:tetratricopeptide repeat protein n=1 Tax=Streptomyces sp. MB09-02B TaxID=3028667 RepID=UPI0029BD3A0E|nr:tetratricopeptide repeat protein [Streptomyces sp. MB09-02B]MDX3641501.1 tetratricopeptide repeat protein [Streptomyces sp. MB09-02B]